MDKINRSSAHVNGPIPMTEGGMISQEKGSQSLVSVIIPTYNRAHYLKEILGSVAAQTYRPIEVIVVDDESTDDTPQMMTTAVLQLREAGVVCQYIVQPKSNGNRARNTGFKLSKGQYAVFMDSDDYAHPEMISRMVARLEQADADFCVCDSARFRCHPGDMNEVKRLSRRHHNARAHIRSIALQTWFLAKRSVFDTVGPWDETITRRQDVEYTFRVLIEKFSGTWISEILYYWRIHDNQISNQTNTVDSAASSLLTLTKMVDYAKLHGQHTWKMRVAFGQESARLAYACNRLGYTALAQQARQLADRECPGIRVLFYLSRIARRILGQNGVQIIRSLFQWKIWRP